jgi:hypothetical protein
MILAALVSALEGRFADRGMRVEANQIVFLAAHPDVGDLTIVDDGDEATVYVGSITHGHFSCYDEKLSESEKAAVIASDVIGFLESLFADRVLLWQLLGPMAGGWQLVEEPVTEMGSRYDLRKWLVWSGPLPHRT